MNRFPAGAIRYWLLSAALFALMALHTANGRWTGDFWEHAAAVRELATHPWGPLHPILDSDAPHAFFSPYNLTVALIARILRLAPVTGLALAGLINLLAFLLIFPWFIRRLFDDGDHHVLAFYSLLLLLLLWGPGAWVWSGFMHVFGLGYVLPYPSMFAFILTLATAASLLSWTNDRRRRWLLIVFPSMILVVLSHPPTAVVMFVLAFWILVAGAGWSFLRTAGVAGAAFLGTLLVAQLWPYFDLASLVLSPDFHAANQELYRNVLPKVAPALPGIPLIAWRLLRDPRDVLGLSFLSLTALYLAGAVTDLWGFARMISMLMILMQLAIGWGLAKAEKVLATIKPTRAVVSRTGLAAVVLYILLFAVNPTTMDRLRNLARRMAPAYREYAFLRLTGQYDVVVADLSTSLRVPALGGKVVASLHPLAFISDHQKRQALVGRFFAIDTPDPERRAFLAAYGADYVLLDRSQQSPALFEILSRMGEPIHEDSRFLLLKAP